MGSHHHSEVLSWVSRPQFVPAHSRGHHHHPGLHPRTPGKEEVSKGAAKTLCFLRARVPRLRSFFPSRGEVILFLHEDFHREQGVLVSECLFIHVAYRWVWSSFQRSRRNRTLWVDDKKFVFYNVRIF